MKFGLVRLSRAFRPDRPRYVRACCRRCFERAETSSARYDVRRGTDRPVARRWVPQLGGRGPDARVGGPRRSGGSRRRVLTARPPLRSIPGSAPVDRACRRGPRRAGPRGERAVVRGAWPSDSICDPCDFRSRSEIETGTDRRAPIRRNGRETGEKASRCTTSGHICNRPGSPGSGDRDEILCVGRFSATSARWLGTA